MLPRVAFYVRFNYQTGLNKSTSKINYIHLTNLQRLKPFNLQARKAARHTIIYSALFHCTNGRGVVCVFVVYGQI